MAETWAGYKYTYDVKAKDNLSIEVSENPQAHNKMLRGITR